MAFSDRLTRACEDGVLLGVKWALVVALVLMALGWALGDYGQTRQRAAKGEQAFEFLQRQLSQSRGAPRGEEVPVSPEQ